MVENYFSEVILLFLTDVQASATWPKIILSKNKLKRLLSISALRMSTYVDSYIWKMKTHFRIPPSNFYKYIYLSVTIQFSYPFPSLS